LERDIDDAFAVDGCENATRMILDLCGGEPSETIVAGSGPDWQKTITFRPSRVKSLTGVEVDEAEMERIISVLGFGVDKTSSEAWSVSVPAWRGDMVDEPCVVEEIIRVNGYHNIPHVSLERSDNLPVPALTPSQQKRRTVRRTLATRGLVEAVTYSFLPRAHAELFGGGDEALLLSNPISTDLDAMRPSVLPNLIAALGRNGARGVNDGALFEVGPQFSGDGAGDQTVVASGVRSGMAVGRNWTGGVRKADAFDAKADALAALKAAGAPVDNVQVFEGGPAWYHPGRSGTLRLGPKTVLANFGEVHPGVLKKMDVKGPVVAFEVFLDSVPPAKKKAGQARPLVKLSSFQSVARDFAFVVDDAVEAQQVLRAAQGADKALIATVSLFDVFVGGNLGAGKKSVAIEVTLQPFEQTLTDEAIEAVSAKVVAAVSKATGGELRG